MSHHLSERQHIDAVKATLGYKEFIVMIATLMATNAIAIDIMLPAMSDDRHFCYGEPMSQNLSEQQHIEAVKANLGYKEFIVMIATLMATNAIAIDIMLPAMTDMSLSLKMSGQNDQHYIIFSYLVGFGLSQLLFGPISDRYGRRKPIIAGLIFYSLSSAACAFAPNFGWLLALRAIQGIGAAATRVLTISIVRDIYGGRQMAEVMSIVMMVFMIVFCMVIDIAGYSGNRSSGNPRSHSFRCA